MDEHGKKFDVLIEDITLTNPHTGIMSTPEHEFKVWADVGLEKLIASVVGVRSVIYLFDNYSVYVDKRYDGQFVRREVEAAILCQQDNT